MDANEKELARIALFNIRVFVPLGHDLRESLGPRSEARSFSEARSRPEGRSCRDCDELLLGWTEEGASDGVIEEAVDPRNFRLEWVPVEE